MFKIPFPDRNIVISDEGFKVTFVSKNTLKYEEGERVASLDFESEGKEINLLVHSFRIESTQLEETSKYEERHRIIHNVVRVLEWKGWSVHVIH